MNRGTYVLSLLAAASSTPRTRTLPETSDEEKRDHRKTYQGPAYKPCMGSREANRRKRQAKG